MKFSKENFGWIFLSFALLILLAISIYLGVSGWFFKTDVSYTTDLTLGRTVSTNISKNQASTISLTFDGSYLPGERLSQIISVTNIDEESDIYLRAKVYVLSGSGENISMDIVSTANWTYNQSDGYFYYNDLLLLQSKATLCPHVIVPNENLQGDHKYILNVVFESLSSEQDVQSLWGINPIENI